MGILFFSLQRSMPFADMQRSARILSGRLPAHAGRMRPRKDFKHSCEGAAFPNHSVQLKKRSMVKKRSMALNYPFALISSTSRSSRSSLSVLLAISHCHTTMTFQPSFFSSLIFRLSRSMFAEIFFSQNSAFVAGNLDLLQPGWPCQKQPWTKTAVRYFGRTMSGLPGNFLSWSLYLKPLEKRYLRTRISGFVSLPLILDIILLRFSLG